jgi:hypothetical protein
MESLHIFLAVIILLLVGVIAYTMLYPTYSIISYPVMPNPPSSWRPHPVMPHFGPYWQHGGQASGSGMLY